VDDDGPAETPDDETAQEPGAVRPFDPDHEIDPRLPEPRDLEEHYVDLDAIPVPRRADQMDPEKKRDLQFFALGCALVTAGLMAVAYSMWGVLQSMK